MNIDIDDILADLDRDTTAIDSSINSHAANDTTILGSDGIDTDKFRHLPVLSAVGDFEKLMAHWRNERMSPELLPYPHLLMERTLRRVQEQLEHIECVSMGYLEDPSAENSTSESSNNALSNKLPLLCMEADLERLKFVLRSFLRCRLAKIDKYSLYLRQFNDEHVLLPLSELLSRQELEYHDRHSAIMLKLLNRAILRHMPPELQAVDDNDGSVKMVDEPEWNRFVFVYVNGPKAKQDSDPRLQVNEMGQQFYPVTIQELQEEAELTIGGIYVMRYNVVRDLILDDMVQLI
ncbi:LANO_0A05336g1_1 [Lachancea nothofagi CBS 11611]|uniref:DNA replication complex GINS protein SLD5 n=1 Tax=Lachancea nothofagi CBS 11611 TaxID=1266666 RepID=A0A1G4IR27_9SACH|nr:LANO_0A05336g1_1 [Lachancea nothofagi CBS 11611]